MRIAPPAHGKGYEVLVKQVAVEGAECVHGGEAVEEELRIPVKGDGFLPVQVDQHPKDRDQVVTQFVIGIIEERVEPDSLLQAGQGVLPAQGVERLGGRRCGPQAPGQDGDRFAPRGKETDPDDPLDVDHAQYQVEGGGPAPGGFEMGGGVQDRPVPFQHLPPNPLPQPQGDQGQDRGENQKDGHRDQRALLFHEPCIPVLQAVRRAQRYPLLSIHIQRIVGIVVFPPELSEDFPAPAQIPVNPEPCLPPFAKKKGAGFVSKA